TTGTPHNQSSRNKTRIVIPKSHPLSPTKNKPFYRKCTGTIKKSSLTLNPHYINPP
ncbi:MAG: hypothetical protein RI897_648, partial [Verrucomicrobiota bacterium]